MAINGLQLAGATSQIGHLDNKIRERSAPRGSATDVADDMGVLINNAIEKLDQGQKAADQSVEKMVAGEPIDLHHVMLQMEESMINLNMAIQVRNKVIEAYQEVQRMQV